MPDPIRVAVLGYGLAGRVFHCPYISAVPGLTLTAIMQRHGDEAVQDYPEAHLLRAPEEAFADPKIDLVVIATPNETHQPLALAALHAGKHVVVDKPLAPSSQGVADIATAARAASRHVIPFHNRRWDGDFLTLQSLIHAHRLGHMVRVVSRWERFRPIPRQGTWKEQASPAHGLLQDLGPHLLDQALTLFGSPETLQANVRSERRGALVDDAFDITLTFHNPASDLSGPPIGGGAPIRYICGASTVAAEPAPRFQAHGTGGSYVKFGVDPQEAHLVTDGRHPPQLGSSVPWIEEPESAWGTLTEAADPAQPGQLQRAQLPTEVGDYRHFYAGVRDVLQGTATAPVSLNDAYRVARLIEMARESSREERTLSVGSIDLAP